MDAEGGEDAQSPAEVRDTAGSQRDHVASGRDLAGNQRDRAGDQRDLAGDERDAAGELRDAAGDQRDIAAERRDNAAKRLEGQVTAASTSDALGDLALARHHAASDRKRAWEDRQAGAGARAHSELDRGSALADRGAGASERTQAGSDRSTALADRDASARERESSAHDDLTGAYVRGAGLVELDREIARAKRTEQPLTLAFVDVDNLKRTNDALGHAGGDRLLVAVADAIRTKLRSYDLLIRYGGDEFVCAITGLEVREATERLSLVNGPLAERPERGSVTIGVAQLLPSDTATDLIARADQELYRERRRQRRVDR